MKKYIVSSRICNFFSTRFIRKLNPLNLTNIALSFGSFNRMNYGQTNWNDNNLMDDINPNSTAKIDFIFDEKCEKWGSSLNRVRMWEWKELGRYNRHPNIRYVKWNFRGYKIVINHQNKFTHSPTHAQSSIKTNAGMTKIKLHGKWDEEMQLNRDMPFQTNIQRYKRSNKQLEVIRM